MEIDHRRYGQGRFSWETGLRLGQRNFRTMAFDLADTLARGNDASNGPLSLSVPLRFFTGPKTSQRTDANEASGFYVGALLRYSHHFGGSKGSFQGAVYRAAVSRVRPFLLLGARRAGRLLDLNVEFMSPIRPFRRKLTFGGQELDYRLWEVFFSVGVGRRF